METVKTNSLCELLCNNEYIVNKILNNDMKTFVLLWNTYKQVADLEFMSFHITNEKKLKKINKQIEKLSQKIRNLLVAAYSHYLLLDKKEI